MIDMIENENDESKNSKSKTYFIDYSKGLSFCKTCSKIVKNHNNISFADSLFDLESKIEEPQLHYFCQECQNFPLIEILNEWTIIHSCGCPTKKVIIVKELFDLKNNYFYKRGNNSISNNDNNITNDNIILNNKEMIYEMKCYKHKSEKGYKYKYYCVDCKKNTCKECCQNHFGDCHNLIIFDFNNQELFKKIIEINKIKKLFEKSNISQNQIEDDFNIDNISSYKMENSGENECEIKPNNYLKYFINLIDIIIYDCTHYPNYSHFYNIENIYRFFIHKIKSSICKIKSENINTTTGFFCNIDINNPYYPSNKSPYLIIMRGKNKKNDIINEKTIEIISEDIKNPFIINIDSEREKYEAENIIFIQIKKEENFYYKINYLEIEENTELNKQDNDFKKITLLHYDKDVVKLNYGKIITSEENTFEHNCTCNENSIDGIILSNNYKILGINKCKKKIGNNNIGYLFKTLVNNINKNIQFSILDIKKFEEKYEIINKIGEGRYGEVFKGKNKNNNELRAIKKYDKDKIKNILKDIFKNNYNELIYKSIIDDLPKYLELMNNLENSVKYYEFYDLEKKLIIIMELCDDNLYNILSKKSKGFSLKEIYDIIHQLNESLKEMNDKNIIHGNIKLQNLLLNYKDKQKNKYKIKISDFGSDIMISYMLKFKDKQENFEDSISFLNDEENNNDDIFLYNKYISIEMDPDILKYKDFNDKQKCDLWSLGISICQLHFKKYLNKSENKMDNLYENILCEIKTKIIDQELKDLLLELLKERTNWEGYINHSFCNENIFQLNQKYYNGEKILNTKTVEINFANKKICLLSDLTNIYFEKLKYLYLNSNNICNIEEFKNFLCIGLKKLDLSNNQIKNIDCISEWNFDNLKSLNLSYNLIENIKVFKNDILKNLKILLLNNNKIKENIELIKEIKNSRNDQIFIDIEI